MIGSRLGNYDIVDRLGAGGMGAVYVARHHLLGKRAAIKVLLPELCGRREAVERFFDEARAITAVEDPGVVQIFDFGHDAGGQAYIVMELLDGESLDARLRRVTRLPITDALRIVRQAATTLARAHAANLVHRDVKPDNLFLVVDAEAEAGERVKVLDFGIAKLTGDDAGARARTGTGVVIGTPLYMAPEQCRGRSGIDHRADVYALGCVLFHAVCGHPPFTGEGTGDILIAHVMAPPPAPSSLVDGVPPELDAIVLRCLAKEPADRYATASELAAALGALSARLTGRGHAPATLPTVLAAAPAPTTLGLAGGVTPVPPAEPRGRGPLAAVAALIAIVAAVVIAVVMRGGSARSADAPADATPRAAIAPSPNPNPNPSPSPSPSPSPTAMTTPIDAGVAAIDPAPIDAAPPPPPIDAARAIAKPHVHHHHGDPAPSTTPPAPPEDPYAHP